MSQTEDLFIFFLEFIEAIALSVHKVFLQVLNKIDLPGADPERVRSEIEEV